MNKSKKNSKSLLTMRTPGFLVTGVEMIKLPENNDENFAALCNFFRQAWAAGEHFAKSIHRLRVYQRYEAKAEWRDLLSHVPLNHGHSLHLT